MLFNGEQIGDGSPPLVDIAVDPLEGTRLTALGMPNAITVIALAERGAMFDPGPCVYMEKLAGGAEIADLLDLERPLPETLKRIAERKGADIRDVMVVMLDRERHQEKMREVREAGARVRRGDGEQEQLGSGLPAGRREFQAKLGDVREHLADDPWVVLIVDDHDLTRADLVAEGTDRPFDPGHEAFEFF